MISVHKAVFLTMCQEDTRFNQVEVHRLYHTVTQDAYLVNLCFSVEINKLLNKFSLCWQSSDILPYDSINAVHAFKAVLKDLDILGLMAIPDLQPLSLNATTQAIFPDYIEALKDTISSGQFVWMKSTFSEKELRDRSERRRPVRETDEQRKAREESEAEELRGVVAASERLCKEEVKELIRHHQDYINDVASLAEDYWWAKSRNWPQMTNMTAAGFLNSIQEELGYKSIIKEVFHIDLPRDLYTDYEVERLKLFAATHREDVTPEGIRTLIDELRLVNGRSLCEGIKKLWRSPGLNRVPKGVQLVLLSVAVASVSEAVCETFGSVMEVSHKTQFFTSPGNEDESCQQHLMISQNAPQIPHCRPAIEHLMNGPFKNTTFCSDRYLMNFRRSKVLEGAKKGLDPKRRQTKNLFVAEVLDSLTDS